MRFQKRMSSFSSRLCQRLFAREFRVGRRQSSSVEMIPLSQASAGIVAIIREPRVTWKP
jgi:hypothetical protein